MESSAPVARPAPAALDPRRWWALALLCGAFFMVLLTAFVACAVLAGIGLALALLLPGRPRKAAPGLPEPVLAASARD